MRVLNLLARLNVGGPALQVTLLTDGLGAPEFQSMMAAGQLDETEGDMSYLADELGVEWVYIEGFQREIKPVQDLKAFWKLYRLMRDFKPHVVHTHTAKAGFLGRVAAALAGVPIRVHTFHGHVFRGYFGARKTQVFLNLERACAKLSHRIFTLTDSLKEEIAVEFDVCHPDLIQVLPLGLNLRKYQNKGRKCQEFRQRWKIGADEQLVGIVGRLVPIKNHKLFVEAARLLSDNLPNTKFVVVGDGEERQNIESQVKELGLKEQFVFTGWERELEPIYSDLDLLVLCSDNEGTPVSLIEAMAAKCPILSTDVGGVRELLDDGRLGALVPPKDPQKLAQAMHDELSKPEAADHSEEIVEQFGIERLAKELAEVYRSLYYRA